MTPATAPTACVDAIVKAMQANPTNGELQVTCCNALAGLKMHRLRGPTGSNQGGKKAADAGALPALVHAMRVVQRSARTALQHVTADDERRARERSRRDVHRAAKGMVDARARVAPGAARGSPRGAATTAGQTQRRPKRPQSALVLRS